MRRCRVKWVEMSSDLVAYLIFFGMVVVLQYCNGAFSNEFGGNWSDEAAHYVTGLMVHDYCWSGDWSHPRAFAEEYYIRYPKVALGHWPPFFYLLQALWMSVFSIRSSSLILFMAVLTVSMTAAVYREARRLHGWWAGLGLGALLLMLPLVQLSSSMLMADILMAFLCFQATQAFGRYLDHNRWQDACAFGLWSGMAIMTKGTGLALALLPLPAVAFSRRFDLLRRWTFWLPAVLVAGLCAPWYFLTLGMVQSGWFESEVSWSYFLKAARFYSHGMVSSMGAGLFALAVLGLFVRLILPAWRGGATARWSAFGALLASSFLFQCLVPCGVEERFLLPVLPVLVIAVVAGAEQAVGFLSSVSARPMPRLLCPISIGFLFLAFVNPMPKNVAVFGYSEAANGILQNTSERGLVLLVSADTCGEGMLVSEVAKRDRRHAHIVLRTSKVLSSSHWSGKDFALRFANEQEIARYFEQLSVDFIVLDMTIPPEMQYPDQRQLLAYVESASSPYRLAGAFPLVRRTKVFPDGIHVYRLQSAASSRPRNIRVPMDAMLGKTLEIALP
ncbi:MAG TPA: glycosyltransferase family 39 protein [Gemmataceae bacterium]|nr:glycosyltransferase family 39 protein [Gemmataceae bacterium]